MARRPHDKPALLVQVLAELGSGRISEEFISDPKVFVHGETVGRHITINPAIAIVDTVLHECLHRLYPHWSERYIKNRTTRLMRCMSDEQVQATYDQYQRIVKRRRRRARADIPALHDGSGTTHQRDGGSEGV